MEIRITLEIEPKKKLSVKTFGIFGQFQMFGKFRSTALFVRYRFRYGSNEDLTTEK